MSVSVLFAVQSVATHCIYYIISTVQHTVILVLRITFARVIKRILQKWLQQLYLSLNCFNINPYKHSSDSGNPRNTPSIQPPVKITFTKQCHNHHDHFHCMVLEKLCIDLEEYMKAPSAMAPPLPLQHSSHLHPQYQNYFIM